MRQLDYRNSTFEQELKTLLSRSSISDDVERSVAELLKQVRTRGNAAVAELAQRFDKVTLTADEFRVSDEELAAAAQVVDQETKEAIEMAHEHVAAFARQRLPENWSFSPREGVTLGEKFEPLQRVATYIPGGTAPLVSTVLHTMTIAQVAGVPEIVLLTPAGPDKSVNPAILYAATVAGATEVYRLGGVYGIAALAYGTETIRAAEKIVGPGNAYVTAAKRQVYGHVALDLVAGPSEILIIGDETARGACVAADILSQAEHGSSFEQTVLVTTSETLIMETIEEVQRQKATLPKLETIDKVLAEGTYLILARDLEHAAEIASAWAPEHLEIMTRDPEAVAANITAAGAIFLGEYTPEPVGDFVAGPSHVLPTGGAARFFSGLSVEMFVRRMSTVTYSREALARERQAIETFARIEQLAAHGRTAAVRFET